MAEATASGTDGATGEAARSWPHAAPIDSSSAAATVSPDFISGVKQQTLQILSNSLSIQMKRAWVIALAVFPLLPMAEAKSRHCSFQVHTEANPSDSAAFAGAVRATVSGKEVVIEKAASITESEVVSFSVYRAPDGTFGALLRLDDHGRTILDTLSVERRGSLLFLFMNGRPLTELQIDKRVSDGQIYIPSGLTPEDLKLMKSDWKFVGPKKEHR